MKLQNLALIVSGMLVFTACGKKNEMTAENQNLNNIGALKNGAVQIPITEEYGETVAGDSSDDESGPSKTCEKRLLNFDQNDAGEAIAAGAVIANQYSAFGVSISAKNRSHGPDLAIAFDSANPTGNDYDLQTPRADGERGNDQALNNLLIVAENDRDDNNDGLVDDPDDNAGGGKIYFEFSEPTRIEALTLIDIEENGAYIKLYDESGELISKVNVPKKGDNSVQTLEFDGETVVAKMKVKFPGSAALDDLKLCVGEEGPSKDEDEEGPGKDGEEEGPGKDGEGDEPTDEPGEEGPVKDTPIEGKK